jgi:hypothetical protein
VTDPFRHCRWSWETPEVSYEYRSKAVIRNLSGTITMSNPNFEFGDKKVNICNVGPAVIYPLVILGGYYPEFRGNVPVISQVANVLVGTVAEVTESTIATALGTETANGLGRILGSPLGPIGCIAMGVWK